MHPSSQLMLCNDDKSGIRCFCIRTNALQTLGKWLFIVCWFFDVESVGGRITVPQSWKHQTLVFSWAPGQQPRWQTWLWGPIFDSGFLNRDPRNQKSESSQQHRGRHSGPCHWWRGPEGLWTQRWPRLGLDGVERPRLWSPPPGSPADHSGKRDQQWEGVRWREAMDPRQPMPWKEIIGTVLPW